MWRERDLGILTWIENSQAPLDTHGTVKLDADLPT